MRCELPEVARCCFCLPLRLGLLVWTYIKLVFHVLLFLLILLMIIDDMSRYKKHILTYIFTPALLLVLMDMIFHIIFITSAHQKDHSKMRVFYRYSIFALVLYILGFVITVSMFFNLPVVPMILRTHYIVMYRLVQLAIFMWIILIQFYVIILIRSEVMKLKRNTNFEFVNHAADPDSLKVDIKNVKGLEY